MEGLRWGSWWRYPCIELRGEGDEAVLVGVGEPEPVDVLGRSPAEQLLPTARELRRKTPPRLSGRAGFTHGLVFASIETPEQALRFAQHYGLLGLRRQDGPKRVELAPIVEIRTSEGFGPPRFEPEPVREWLRWARRLREALEGVRRLSAANVADGRRAAVNALQAEWTVELEDRLELRISNGRPVLVYRRLLTALLADVALTLAGVGYAPMRCQARDCGRWFIPQHPQAAYCSLTCRRREQNRRMYQNGRKKGVEA